MPQHFVRIVNRGTYTNPRKAQKYVDRELAVPVEHDERGRIIAIQMLEAAELAVLRSLIVKENRVSNHDDGIQRRWTNCISGRAAAPQYASGKKLLDSKVVDGKTTCGLIVKSPGGIESKQLRPIRHVGTGKGTTKTSDGLKRRQSRRPAAYDPRTA